MFFRFIYIGVKKEDDIAWDLEKFCESILPPKRRFFKHASPQKIGSQEERDT